MEGVVIVEKLSGALVFTRSFTDAFDLRHPRSERMNLSALLFALLNFADNSMLSSGTTQQQQPSSSSSRNLTAETFASTPLPGICMFATPQERFVIAQTPSKKLFVALVTASTLDSDVAKSLVQRLAYNYEHGDSLENRIAIVLNQGPRLFRDALGRSIEEQVDDMLGIFATLLSSISSNHSNGANPKGTAPEPAEKPAFMLFYFSDHLLYKKCRELADNSSDIGDDGAPAARYASATPSSPLGSLGFRSPLALGSPTPAAAATPAQTNSRPSVAADKSAQPPRPGLSRAQSNLSMRSLYASTRSLFPNPPTRDADRGGKRKKKAKKNAVMDHAEPQVFQRAVHFNASQSEGERVTHGEGGSTTDGIIYVVVPFVKQVIPLFFPAPKTRRQSKLHQQQQTSQLQEQTSKRPELKQITWKNFSLEQSPPQQHQETAKAQSVDLVAWKQGNCLIIYPDSAAVSSEDEKAAMSESARLRRQREWKSAVITLFDALEPLVQALMISRT